MLLISALNIANNITIIIANDNFLEKQFSIYTTILFFLEISLLSSEFIILYHGFKVFDQVKTKN